MNFGVIQSKINPWLRQFVNRYRNQLKGIDLDQYGVKDSSQVVGTDLIALDMEEPPQ